MPSFQIGDAPTQVTLQPPASGGEGPSGTVSFPVRNLTTRAQTGRIRIEPLGNAKAEWFALEGAPSTSPGEIERDFDASGSHVAVVKVSPAAHAAPGSYTFQLRVTAEHDPDTDVALGPVVGFNVIQPPAAAPAGSFPWWAVAVAAFMVLAVGGIVAFFVLRGDGEDPNLVAVPAVAGQAHAAAGQGLADAGFGAVFTLTTQGDGVPGLHVVRSDPEEGSGAAPGSAVTLHVKSPDGPCGSLICSFPNQLFPPDVIALLSPKDFDPKFAPALSVSGGQVTVDQARFAEIENPPPPEEPVARILLPRIANVDITQAATILLDLGLTMEAVAVAEGAEDGKVRRTIPAGPREATAGETIVVLYRPKPRAICRTIFCQMGAVTVNPNLADFLKRNEFAADVVANPAVLDNQRIILRPDMLRQR